MKTKKLSLNETWKLCLQMWKWIAGQRKKGNKDCVGALKFQWLKEHDFDYWGINCRCFFCEYANQPGRRGCKNCPAVLVSPRFGCENTTYDYWDNPIAFYNKLVSLNKKRQKKKEKPK